MFSKSRRLSAAMVLMAVVLIGGAAAKADTVKFVSWGEFSHPKASIPGGGMSVSNSHGTSSISVGDLSLLFTGVNASVDITDAGNGVMGDYILGAPVVNFGLFSLPSSTTRPKLDEARLHGTQFTLFVTQIEPNPFPAIATGSLHA